MALTMCSARARAWHGAGHASRTRDLDHAGAMVANWQSPRTRSMTRAEGDFVYTASPIMEARRLAKTLPPPGGSASRPPQELSAGGGGRRKYSGHLRRVAIDSSGYVQEGA